MNSAHEAKKGMELARDIAWRTLADADGPTLASRCGATWDDEAESWCLAYLDRAVTVPRRERTVVCEPADLTLMEEILVLRYLCHCDGSRPTGRWLSFRELPGGRMYHGPFTGRTTKPLATRFGHSVDAFRAAASACRGEVLPYGDAAFLFRLLPHFWLAVILHQADDEFAADANIVFDESIRSQFSTEDCVAAGQVLCRRLLRAAPRS